MKGILYGVGVGPGDPEMMTLQAVKTIALADIVAAPHTGEERSVALDIARAHTQGKRVEYLDMPMTHDKRVLNAAHDAAAAVICAWLNEGKTVVFLTLGDVSIYSTFAYVQRRVEARGYAVQLIPGVPAMCAMAAKLGKPIVEGRECVRVIPALSAAGVADVVEAAESGENVVVMKAGSRLMALKQALAENGLLAHASMVERCGMKGEKVCETLTDCNEDAGYFSTILIKGRRLDSQS